MKLTFLGATRTVTGSRYLLEGEGVRVLVDCGLFQGLKELRLRNWEPFPVDPRAIDAVLLTHAHIDHSGYLPVLMNSGFRGKIYCSTATEELCRILLPDSGKLQEEEAEYANRKGFSKHHPARPLYTAEDGERCLKQFLPIGYREKIELASGVSFELVPAGHILGASLISVEWGPRHLVFSGDLGRPNDPVILPPAPMERADFLVVESTYGGRAHDPADWLTELQSVISRTLGRSGVVLVPAFSVGRTQSLLYGLYLLKREKRIPDVPVFLNSPMSIDVTQLLCQYQGEHRLNPTDCRGACEVARYIRTPEQSKALNRRTGPMIIISASGMATGGRVLHHLKAFAPDPRNTILLTGFQAVGTRGAKLLAGAKELKMHGEMIPVRAEVALLDSLSAHADQGEILQWLSHFQKPPRRTFITHGEPQAALALQAAIEKKPGWHCHIPEYREQVELGSR